MYMLSREQVMARMFPSRQAVNVLNAQLHCLRRHPGLPEEQEMAFATLDQPMTAGERYRHTPSMRTLEWQCCI